MVESVRQDGELVFNTCNGELQHLLEADRAESVTLCFYQDVFRWEMWYFFFLKYHFFKAHAILSKSKKYILF
jgi:hypothetical protein